MSVANSLKLSLSAVAVLCFVLLGLSAPASAYTDLQKVRMVDYGAGAFVQTGPKTWAEVSKSTWKILFQFNEYSRDSVGLNFEDTSRNIRIWVDSPSGQILYSSVGSFQPLYSIVGTSNVSRIPGSQIAWDGSIVAKVRPLEGNELPAVAQSFDGYAWKYTRARKAGTVGTLTFGSGAGAQVVLVCTAKGGDATVTGNFGAALDGLQAGTKLKVQFTGGGFSQAVAARASAGNGSSPEGFQYTATIGDPLWAAMQGRRSLAYQTGSTAITLPLASGSGDIAQFIAECANAKQQ